MTYTDLIGCKFKVHGRNKQEGFDCYGLAIEVLKRNNIYLKDTFYNFDNLNEVSSDLHSFNKIEKIENPVKNCIIEITVKGLPTHIGVYIGNGMMIHSIINYGVIIEPISRYKKRIVGYYKVSNNQPV